MRLSFGVVVVKKISKIQQYPSTVVKCVVPSLFKYLAHYIRYTVNPLVNLRLWELPPLYVPVLYTLLLCARRLKVLSNAPSNPGPSVLLRIKVW
jgi:hypothetical protein